MAPRTSSSGSILSPLARHFLATANARATRPMPSARCIHHVRRRDSFQVKTVKKSTRPSRVVRMRGPRRACKPDSVRDPKAPDGHFSGTTVARRLVRPTRKSVTDRASPWRPCGPAAPLFGLAPSGVYRARPVARPAGELLPHRFTLTARTVGPRGGLLSVALSLPLRAVGVTHHCALRSPDFPPQGQDGPLAHTAPGRPSRPPGSLRELYAMWPLMS